MALIGACSNRDASAMERMDAMRRRLVAAAGGPTAPEPIVSFEPPPIRVLVMEVLVAAATDLRTTDVRARVSQRHGDEVSWSSVRNALVDLVARGTIERVGYGRYRVKASG